MKDNIEILKSHIKNGIGVCHLVYPSDEQENEHIFVASDTSQFQTGAIIGNLTLDNDEISNVRVCGYSSKALEEPETFLSARARELAGLMHGINSFKDLLPKDARLIFIVDHKSLEDLHCKPSLKPSSGTRARRAYSSVMEFSRARVIYLPNTSDIIKTCDNLSRHPIFEIDHKAVFHPSILCPKRTKENSSSDHLNNLKLQIPRPKVDVRAIIDAQKKCTEISGIRENIEQNKSKNNDYFLLNDLVYKKVRNKKLVVIPESLTIDIINYFHQALFHIGEKPLLQHLNKNEHFLFKQKGKHVKACVKSCLRCNHIHRRYKTADVKQKLEPTLRPYSAVYADTMHYVCEGKKFYF
ncbi:Oidioi.mRNA.OKI2018_I69.YSR.g17147.t1.cds [Oikopleura dioica]|uniref:Oidioi.mRNA.OKI2018_I69.YSR.g17147.t1.cds n=1 Tax=Oikopleura dioica TaxID=34765 RepID=A0ABN7SIB3_OIKDI|nr:Oidioi.mRNA.OKI2018_I69.YSR.g17147.t1.cds [Oikopleura dioica]